MILQFGGEGGISCADPGRGDASTENQCRHCVPFIFICRISLEQARLILKMKNAPFQGHWFFVGGEGGS